jgi:SAM-dependent methyltransferase
MDEIYKEMQFIKYKSHEFEIPRWYEGQKRFIQEWMSDIDKESKILDVACGDGVGLRYFKEFGYTNLVGIEYEKEKATNALSYGYPVYKSDMHNLDCCETSSFDVIYSSHTVEHSYDPKIVISEFKRILKDNGKLVIVLPYPDTGPIDAHCGKLILSTDKEDSALGVRKFFQENGFKILDWKLDNFREPEIWLKMEKYESYT